MRGLEAHLAVWAVLSLRQQVSCNVSRGGGSVCNDQHLRGAGRHVHGDHGLAVLQRHLGSCHILVARAKDLVHLRQGLTGIDSRSRCTVSGSDASGT